MGMLGNLLAGGAGGAVGGCIFYYAVGDSLIAAMLAGGVGISTAVALNALVILVVSLIFAFAFERLFALATGDNISPSLNHMSNTRTFFTVTTAPPKTAPTPMVALLPNPNTTSSSNQLNNEPPSKQEPGNQP